MELPQAVKRYGPDLGRYVASNHGPDVVAHELHGDGARRSQEVLTRVFAHVRALEVADFLAGEPLAEVEAAAAPLVAKVEAAQETVTELEQAHAGVMVAYWQHPAGKPAPAEPRALGAAREALVEAKQEARYPLYEVQMTKDKIAYLRTKTAPNPADLALLAAALKVEV